MRFGIAILLACLIATSSPAQSAGGGGTVYLRQLERGTAGYVITAQGAGGVPIYTALAGAGLGDFSGPASSTANAIVRFSGVGGKTGKDSAITIADTTGAMTWAAAQNALLTAGSSGATLTLGQGAGGIVSSTRVFDFAVTADSTQVFTIQNTSTGTAANTRLTFVAGASSGSIQLSGSGNTTPNILRFTSPLSQQWLNNGATKMTLTDNLLIGGTTDIAGTGGGKFFGTTAASSTTTGAFQLGSNVGLSGNAGGPSYFGGAINLGTNLSFGAGTATMQANGNSIQLTHSANATTGFRLTDGANTVVVTASNGVNAAPYIGSTNAVLFGLGTAGAVQVTIAPTTGNVALTSTTEATTGGVGSITTAGGIYATKSIFAGGTINATGAVVLNGGATMTGNGTGGLTVNATGTNQPAIFAAIGAGTTALGGIGTGPVTLGNGTGNVAINGNTTVTGNFTVTGVTTIAGSSPATSSSSGNTGNIVWDGSYIYICVALNTWKRVAIATW